MCNDKLIGARYYLEGFGRKFVARDDYLSPRDGDGHGSHTASTAAGNKVTDVAIDGVQFEDGIASGMAPGAKVAAYKVCWEGAKEIPAGCFNSDSVAAINDAVLDGVDVLNYSIGGTSESERLDRGRPGISGCIERRRLRRQLGREQRSRCQHARPPGAMGDHGRRLHRAALLPSRRARQRHALRRRLDHASAGDAHAARHLGEREARRRHGRRRCALRARHARSGARNRQDRAMRPRRRRPHRQELRGAARRRRRDGDDQHLTQLTERRLPPDPVRARRRDRSRRDPQVPRDRGCAAPPPRSCR